MMELSADEINDLARISVNLQYRARNNTIPGVQLASQLLSNLRTNKTTDTLTIIGHVTGNYSRVFAEEVLEKFQYLPTGRRHGHAALWISITILSGIIVMLRLYSRLRYSSGLKVVDWVLLAAWLIATANNAEDAYLALYHNFESHCWNISLYDINMHFKVAAVDMMLGVTSQFLFKLALLLFYHEIYKSTWFRFTTYVMGFVVVAYMIVSYVWFIIRCSPYDTWNYAPGEYHCNSHDLELFYALTAINIPIDLVIIGLPIVPIFRLQLSKSKKAVVAVLIGVGGLVVVASILRLTTLKEYVESSDVTQRALNATTWQIMEVHLGIICSSVPSMRKLVQVIVKHYQDIQEERRLGTSQFSRAASIAEIIRRVSTGGWQPRNNDSSSQPSRISLASEKHKPDFSNYRLRAGSTVGRGAMEKDDQLDQKCLEVIIV